MKVREKGYENWEDASEYSKFHSEEFIAQDFATYCYYDDPCDPDKFEMTVEVLNDEDEIKVFTVTAEADVNFYVEELEDVAED